MNWLEFAEKMFGHLVWPAVVLIIAFAVRRHLGSLAERVLELSFGGATVKFGKLLSKGSDIIEEAPTPPALSGSDVPKDTEPPTPQEQYPTENDLLDAISSFSANMRQFMDRQQDLVSETNTQSAAIRGVFSSFDHLEMMLEKAGEQLGVKARGLTLMEMLHRRGLVDKDLVDLYKNLRAARNAMAHGKSDLPNEAECIEFVRQAAYLSAILAAVANRIQREKEEKGSP